MALWFDDGGWLKDDDPLIDVHHRPTHRVWKGMHSYIADNFGNQLQGTITHYTAMDSAESTVRAMTRKNRKGNSTHFIIGRDGAIWQLASINDRTWHAGFKRDSSGAITEWGGAGMMMANGHICRSPNQWFVGIDLANYGWLKKTTKGWSSHDKRRHWSKQNTFTGRIGSQPVYQWEPYTDEALESWSQLMMAIVLDLDIEKDMNYRHQDTSPTRKTDPGPAFPFHDLLDEVYEDVAYFDGFAINEDPHRAEDGVPLIP